MDYDVRTEDLRTCATRLVTDAHEIDAGCDDAYVGVGTATSGVNGGPLVGALAELGRAVADVSRTTGSAVRSSGTRLGSNADRYDADDADAAQELGGCVPEGGYAPPVFPSTPTPGAGPLLQRGPWTGEPSVVPAPYRRDPSDPLAVPA